MQQIKYVTKPENFSKIPGSPIAYWATKNVFEMFNVSKPLATISYSFQGMITGDNNYFLRLWQEVNVKKLQLGLTNNCRTAYSNVWVPYNKGGDYRRWYGNNEYVLRWIDNGRTLTRARTENIDYYFRAGVTWSFLTSGTFSSRYFPDGYLWDVAGSSIFANSDDNIFYICALMNSKVAQMVFDITNPTLNYQVMNIIALPYINSEKNEELKELSKINISYSKEDWDSFETSWDFKKHPLI